MDRTEALDYHRDGRPGKLEIQPTKPSHTQHDLSLAYSPGVAEPCREIAANPEDSFVYTARGNLVAVVSNGTAVLGLGDIGPLASKPVMEGKAVLFKRFADIDVFDIELACDGVDELCRTVAALEPTFGGINLEDIKAPECFEIERRLSETMEIPVFHDDQHGTAIISAAAFLNWLALRGRDAQDARIVFSGAGAAALSCARMMLAMGAREENVLVCDSRGVLTKARASELNEYKKPFARDTDVETLRDALRGADVFVGLSVGGLVDVAMVESMAEAPLIMALANPDPEIPYDTARAARPDAIVCTGRSDFPNQVNNVLGFPYLFRGALDVRARKIDDGMKVAAVHALAELAREPVPEVVNRAYGGRRFEFGDEYVIPTPMDPRVLTRVAPAVAKAACASGVARRDIEDWDGYVKELEQRLGTHSEIMRFATERARCARRRIVFPDGAHDRVLRAVAALVRGELAEPVLVGERRAIEERIRELDLGTTLDAVEIHEPAASDDYEDFCAAYWRMRERRGVSRFLARRDMTSSNLFASMMLRAGKVDAMVTGLGASIAEMLGPVFSIVGCRDPHARAAGVHLVMRRNEIFFFADTTAQIEPTAEQLADVAVATAELARRFEVEPRIAMISYSNFGSVSHPDAHKMRRAAELVRAKGDYVVDGEMHVDTALMPEFREQHFPFTRLTGRANVLIFPNLAAGNIAFKMAQCMGASLVLGPFLVGLAQPVAMLNRYAGVSEIVQSAVITGMLSSEITETCP